MWHQAHYDSLTNLPNRKFFIKNLTQALTLAAQNDSLLAILYIDLDGFKAVNDDFGHAAGDELLIKAAQRINKNIRSTDHAARLGGDEFTVILTNIRDSTAARTVAEKIIHALAQPFTLQQTTVRISASIGVALYPEDAQTQDELIQCADSAMYHSQAVWTQ